MMIRFLSITSTFAIHKIIPSHWLSHVSAIESILISEETKKYNDSEKLYKKLECDVKRPSP